MNVNADAAITCTSATNAMTRANMVEAVYGFGDLIRTCQKNELWSCEEQDRTSKRLWGFNKRKQ